MRKIISTALLIDGLVLLYFGYNEYQSKQSEINEFFTGSPSDHAVWLRAGGGAATVAGIVRLLRGSKKSSAFNFMIKIILLTCCLY